jgi:hypothetical protein
MDYLHLLERAPTAAILDAFKKAMNPDRQLYEEQFLDPMRSRQIETKFSRELLDGGCLLCSEELPHYCHRRLVTEYLTGHWEDVNTVHLPGLAVLVTVLS